MASRIAIVGAGPGGLTAAMILAHRGFDVTVLERESYVGGRNSEMRLGDYRFDLGPTFLMMKFILDEVFEEAGTKSEDHLEFTSLDPMYRLIFKGKTLDATADHRKMERQLRQLFPGNEAGYKRFLEKEKKRFRLMYPCLQKEYAKFRTFFHKDFLRALPSLSLGSSMFQRLGRYYDDELLKISFTFQSKYLGMSPWDCPAAFLIIPYIEHQFGVFHTTGGLSEIARAMAEVAERNGAKIRLGCPVKRLMLDGKDVTGVELESGEKIFADDTIVNADFGYAMSELVDQSALSRYSAKALEKKGFSCSTFMLYLGLDKLYDMPHHTILFAEDYRRNIHEVTTGVLSKEFSIYIRNASVTDKTLAPPGHSAVYILVPIPNQRSGLKWDRIRAKVRGQVIDTIKRRTSMKDIDRHIVVEQMIDPADWAGRYNIHLGATFNLAHTLGQMLYFRPHNKFEELGHCYLVGGGTHPGSGLPTIYESGRITANMVCRENNVPFSSKNKQIR
jgi:phytoene desaturase